MLFNSLTFLIFFPAVTLLYFLLSHKYRWAMLLLASCIFYMAFIPVYILVLFALIAIDYTAALFIEKSTGRRRKLYLTGSIFATCLVLFLFKYFGFFEVNLSVLAQFIGWNYSIGTLNLILPIGLSFHTFQSLSYVIEVFRGRQKAVRNPGIYALYVMFYPQLVAGPIERPYHMLHQFYEKHAFNYQRVVSGLALMLWGMFKKVVIADRLAIFVDQAYGSPLEQQGVSLIVATVFFAFQIYCDFSGYSDIAIGAARVMGFDLMKNFNIPYFAKSVSEFWKRWHISLSTWFRDYLYIPLGGNRVPLPRWYFNILVVFLISGFWHGADWTFIVWGGLHGVYIVVESKTERMRKRIPGFFQILGTFSLVSFAWIFFRAETFGDALYIASHIFSGVGSFCANALQGIMTLSFGQGVFAPLLLGQPPFEFFLAIISIVFLLFVHVLQTRRVDLQAKPVWVRWGAYYFLLAALLLFGVFDRSQQFIYFQF